MSGEEVEKVEPKKFSKVKEGLGRVVHLANHPNVRAVSKLSRQILDIIYRVKPKNPMSAVTAGLSLLDSVAESFQLPEMDGIAAYVRNHKLKSSTGMLGKIIFTSSLYGTLTRSVVVESETNTLIELKISEQDRLYIIRHNNQSSMTIGSDSRSSQIDEEFYTTPNFDFEKLFALIWKQYASGIYLKRHRRTYEFGIAPLPVGEPVYIGEHDPVKFSESMLHHLSLDISRSYLFNGLPGSGKTSFALIVARRNFQRIVKLDPVLVSSLETGELEFFIAQLKPQVLIFEDFDRVFNGVNNMLFLLENIKQSYPDIVIMATSNDPGVVDAAVLRPGRIDQILEFDVPSEADRKKILEKYLAQYKIELKPETIEQIVDATGDLTPAYLKEIAIRSKACSDAEVMEMIDKWNFYLSPEDERSNKKAEKASSRKGKRGKQS